MARANARKTRSKYSTSALEGKMSEGRYAWVKTILGQWAILRYRNMPDAESGLSILLLIPRPGYKPLTMNFTSLTHEEFVEVKKFFNLLFDQAEPVIIERDKVAQDAFDAGDDSYTRSYRQSPQFIVREGAVSTYAESVHERPEDVPSGHGQGGGDPGGVRSPGSEVAEREPEDRGSEDDEPQAD